MGERLAGREYANVIKSEIRNENVQEKINAMITKTHKKGDKQRIDKDSVMDALRKEGLVDKIIESLLSRTAENLQQSERESHSRPPLKPPGAGQYVCISLVAATGISDHLLSETDPRGQKNVFQFVLSYQKQRHSGRLIPCVRDPIIDQQFFVKITDGEAENTSISSLLFLSEPVHLVLLKRDLLTEERRLIASQVLEWRTVLCGEAGSALIVDMHGVYDDCKVLIGRLEVRLSLAPDNGHERPLRLAEVEARIREEGVLRGPEEGRRFLGTARLWWQAYKEALGGASEDRRVKIFAQDENGLNRFVCDYVRPLRAGRLLDSPSLAARFVASVPVQTSLDAIGSASVANHDLWKSALSFLLENRGNTENHALMLCSLLLGHGLNAYVALGEVKDDEGGHRPHCWVVTFQEEHPEKATFWEACTGKQHPFASFPHHRRPPGISFEYASIGCLFNDRRLLGNVHRSPNIEHTTFSLENGGRWKQLTNDSLSKGGCGVPLCVGGLIGRGPDEDEVRASNDLERQLRTLLEAARAPSDVTAWDDQLCYLLGQALAAYELEKVSGVANVGCDHFREAVQRHVPDGHTFKAFPIHVLHTNARLVLDTALKSPIFKEIIECRGADVRMAVRARTFRYAEQATATWVVFGCTYQFTNDL